jgi:hypothetical protein
VHDAVHGINLPHGGDPFARLATAAEEYETAIDRLQEMVTQIRAQAPVQKDAPVWTPDGATVADAAVHGLGNARAAIRRLKNDIDQLEVAINGEQAALQVMRDNLRSKSIRPMRFWKSLVRRLARMRAMERWRSWRK